MRVASSVDAAQDAVSGFAGVTLEGGGEQVSMRSSSVPGMKSGAQVANELFAHIADLVSAVKGRADGVPALAAEIEARDKQDAAHTARKQ